MRRGGRRRQILILRAGRHLSAYRHVKQELLDFGRTHLARMVPAMEQKKPAYPRHTRLLGAQAVVFQPRVAAAHRTEAVAAALTGGSPVERGTRHV